MRFLGKRAGLLPLQEQGAGLPPAGARCKLEVAVEGSADGEFTAGWSERAVRELAGSKRAHIERLLRGFGVPAADVPDARQQVLLIAWRKLGELQDPARLDSWLFTLCRRVAKDERRRAYRKRERPLVDLHPMVDDLERGLLGRERLRFVRHACERELSPGQRDAVLACALEEGAVAQLAPGLGCPPKTVFSRLYAGRQRLLAALRRAGLAAVLPWPWLRRLSPAFGPKLAVGAALAVAFLVTGLSPGRNPSGVLVAAQQTPARTRFVGFTRMARARPAPDREDPAAGPAAAAPGRVVPLTMAFDVFDVAQPELGVRLQQVSALEFEPLFVTHADTFHSTQEPVGPATYPQLNKPRLVGRFAPAVRFGSRPPPSP